MINVHTINVLQKKPLKQLFDLSLLKPAKIGSLTSKNDMVLSGQDLASWGPLGLSHFRAPTHSINDLNPESQLKKITEVFSGPKKKKKLW